MTEPRISCRVVVTGGAGFLGSHLCQRLLAEVPRPEDEPQVRQPDVLLATAEIGWKPEVPLAEGLARTIEWFREDGNTRV